MEDAATAIAATPSASTRPARSGAGPVRVVARICPGGGSGGSFRVAARVSDAADSSAASVSFIPINKQATPAASGALTTRKDHEYKLDYCYMKDDSSTRIFNSEVKHLLDDIFCGEGHSNACVITCGAAAKTDLIMGFQDHPGLLTMAMEQILNRAKPTGAEVSISSYQVLQDSHIFDLLEPKDSEVHVLEDADGRTHLKGLSKVPIKSIKEFSDLCCGGSYKLKHSTKPSNQMQIKGHQGFVIYISRFDRPGRECAVSKINFLDLAGYVDTKQKNGGGGFAPSNCNKSLYAIMNVVQSLNSNQSFIPYRPYKVTRILQDSLCKTSGAVLICCMDEVSCQDAISTLTLASRSSQKVNEQFYNLSLGTRSSKSNVNLSMSAKNLSRSLLPSIQQRSSVLQKYGRTQFINSAVKATRTPTANKRSEVAMRSAKKPVSSASTSINMKHSGAKSIPSGRRLLFSPTTNSSKEDNRCVMPTMVAKSEEAQSSLGMAIQAISPTEACDETEKVLDVVSSEMQEVVPCSVKELVSVDMREKDHSSSDLHAENSYTDFGLTCLSDIADEFAQKTPACATNSSPKLSDRLKEISNSLKLLSTRPVNITKQKPDMVCAQHCHTDVAEPKTPTVHLKFGHVEDLQESLKGRSTGIKKSLAQECLVVLNSANKEQLKSLKGIGEKRANYILELREESPEPFKNIDDLRTIIGMNKKEINKMMSAMVLDSEIDKEALC